MRVPSPIASVSTNAFSWMKDGSFGSLIVVVYFRTNQPNKSGRAACARCSQSGGKPPFLTCSIRGSARFIRCLLDSENLVLIIGVHRFQISFFIKCECRPIAQKRILGTSRRGSVLRLRDQAHTSGSLNPHLGGKEEECTTVDDVSEPLLLELLIHRIQRIVLHQQTPPFGRKPTLV